LLHISRELRDLIYFYIVHDDDSPLDITKVGDLVPVDQPTISAEWLEAIYTQRVLRVTFSTPEFLRDGLVSTSPWGPYPQHLHSIRHLIISAPEARFHEPNLEDLEHHCTIAKPEVRQEWNDLLSLPRLETLTIELQKSNHNTFTWANFSPIVYYLREHHPKLDIRLHISFDQILKAKWEVLSLMDPVNGGWILQSDPYLPMGFVDVTELIEPPTDEDREYVKEHLPGSTDVGARGIYRGLLDETPESRRLLALHYVVKEPALLRVLMEEHYEIYKRVSRQDGARGELGSGGEMR
jgi:hypothetical protein